MDFIDKLKQFSERAKKLKNKIETEEATKTSLIMPFFQLLGYDVFNPNEFTPEFTADVGIKKGEKVDYAIMLNDEPLILIEAKACQRDELKRYGSQLFRYFGTTHAKFAILTNGITYMFYTDLDEPNKMDSKPFYIFDIFDLKESKVNELKRFKKENLDVDTIINTAAELKYSNEIKQLMEQLFEEPSDSFVNFVLGEVYPGKRTQNVKEKFKGIIKTSLNQFVNEMMNEIIKNAIEKQSNEETQSKANSTEKDKEPKIVTTLEELEAYFIVKTLLREIVDPERITYKDTQSYFGILLEDNTWKWICRVYIKESTKYLTLPDEKKNEVRYQLKKIQDIYDLKNELIQSLKRYL